MSSVGSGPIRASASAAADASKACPGWLGFSVCVQGREVGLLEGRQQRGPVLGDEAVKRREGGLARHAGMPGVEPQVLSRLDEGRIRRDAAPIGQVGEVAPREGPGPRRRPVRNDDLQRVSRDELGCAPRWRATRVGCRRRTRSAQIGGERLRAPRSTGRGCAARLLPRARTGGPAAPRRPRPPGSARRRAATWRCRAADQRDGRGAGWCGAARGLLVDAGCEEGLQRRAHAGPPLRRAGRWHRLVVEPSRPCDRHCRRRLGWGSGGAATELGDAAQTGDAGQARATRPPTTAGRRRRTARCGTPRRTRTRSGSSRARKPGQLFGDLAEGVEPGLLRQVASAILSKVTEGDRRGDVLHVGDRAEQALDTPDAAVDVLPVEHGARPVLRGVTSTALPDIPAGIHANLIESPAASRT